MQPIIYTSSDAGAPQLSATAGALNVILKACLITGYGTKVAAGWQALVDDATAKKLVLQSKNPKSVKSALALINTNASYATVTAYKSWDIVTNAGIESFGTGFIVNNYQNATPRWTVLATDTFFYMFIQTEAANTNAFAASGFGDAISLDATRDYAVLMSASASGYTIGSVTHKTLASNQGTITFPLYPYGRDTSAGMGFGDRTNNNTNSEIAVFSQFPLYVTIGINREPACMLPGALMSYADLVSRYDTKTFLYYFANQLPYANPVIAHHQAWAGKFFIHTDDWG